MNLKCRNFLRRCAAVCSIYVFILFFGALVKNLLGTSRIDQQRADFYLLRPGNVFNSIFAYGGNSIWFVLFVGMCCLNVHFRTDNRSLLEDREIRGFKNHFGPETIRLAKLYMMKYFLKCFVLMFLFSIMDNIFLITGGSCLEYPDIKNSTSCHSKNGKWDGGFDISGHFTFIMSISLIIWAELISLKLFVEEEELEHRVNIWVKIVVASALVCLLSWILLLMITSIYYHTFFEKILGCAFGFMTPGIYITTLLPTK